MGRIKSRKTLRDDIEKLQLSSKKTSISRRRIGFKILFSFMLLTISYLTDMIYYAVLFLLVIDLFRCVLAKLRFQKNKCMVKELKQLEIMIRTAAETILLLYFILLGLALAIYVCMHYMLQVSGFWLAIKGWMQNSILIFLLFEIILLAFYRKIEREVR